MTYKTVLITGASSGIGKSIGLYLISKGYIVYGTTRSLAKNKDFQAFPLLEMDVRNTVSVSKAIADLLQKEGHLDVLINNAGIGITGPLEETPHEEIVGAFDTNFNGPLHVIKAVLPQMRKQKKGLIINITSVAGYMGLPYRGIYSAAKSALGIMTEALRMEVKDFGVHIANLAPGDFATNIAAGRYHAPVQEKSPYAQSYSSTLQQINEGVTNGENPVMVAKVILKIIRAKKPKIHYKVGTFIQRFSLVLKAALPDKVFEKMLLKHYKL